VAKCKYHFQQVFNILFFSFQSLEAELKKLQNSIQESTQNFDDHLKRLFERRVKAEMVVNQVNKSFTSVTFLLRNLHGPSTVLRKFTNTFTWGHGPSCLSLGSSPASCYGPPLHLPHFWCPDTWVHWGEGGGSKKCRGSGNWLPQDFFLE
jgi:hypothetical protein